MRTIGNRINVFDNFEEQTVKSFNQIFDEVPILGYNDSDLVVICEITKNAMTRTILINNIAKEHCFERRLTSENDYIDLDNSTNNDPDWLFYFV